MGLLMHKATYILCPKLQVHRTADCQESPSSVSVHLRHSPVRAQDRRTSLLSLWMGIRSRIVMNVILKKLLKPLSNHNYNIIFIIVMNDEGPNVIYFNKIQDIAF